VDGFDQDEAESKRDERAVILRRLLASKCDTLEASLKKEIALPRQVRDSSLETRTARSRLKTRHKP
jgi:hypothetical protein